MNEMTHQDALEELAVEHYLLDELQGEARDRFEAHLFECTACAADLKSGLLFVEAAKQELQAENPAKATQPIAAAPVTFASKWWTSLFQPWVLTPALAACLAVIAYQSAVVLPRMQSQLAQAETPSIVNSLTLANAGARGDAALPEVTAPQNGVYLLAVDLPPSPGAAAYRCTLYDSADKAVWHTDVPASPEKDSVKIQVPMGLTGPGNNSLEVQPIGPQQEKLTGTTHYRFKLLVSK